MCISQVQFKPITTLNHYTQSTSCSVQLVIILQIISHARDFLCIESQTPNIAPPPRFIHVIEILSPLYLTLSAALYLYSLHLPFLCS